MWSFTGGTIDVTVHIKGKWKARSYAQFAIGLHVGGNTVNECFEEYCAATFGQKFKELRENHPDDYLFLMENFEQEKIQFTVDKLNNSESIRVRLPGNLTSNSKDKLSIPSKTFRSFFNATIEKLVKQLEILLLSDVNEMQNVQMVFVVGGFAQSSIVINELKNKFDRFNIVVPENPELAVMHGAVIFGFQ